MAVDELLLEGALAGGTCSLRLYRWEAATLSLGYFQRPDAVAGPPELASLPRVRRLSGGGAIVHDQELTYSCGLPPEHPWSRSPLTAYAAVHACIIAVMADFNLECRLRGESLATSDDGFLCFDRKDRFDVVSRGHKVLGSAQRRRKGAVLQHGSLVLRRSAYAPQFPGLLDVSGLTAEPFGFQNRLAQSLAGCLAETYTAEELTDAELAAARQRVQFGQTGADRHVSI